MKDRNWQTKGWRAMVKALAGGVACWMFLPGPLAFSAAPGSGVDAIVGSGTEAIVGSGKNAIVGSGTEAIVGSGKNAIVGSGTEAIVGSGKNAIVGSGTEAIVGSGKNAIVGSGTEAIVGSGKNAIVGSGTEAIVGSGKNAIVGSGTEAIVGSGKNAIVGSGKPWANRDRVFGPVLSGPVTALDLDQRSITILGQDIKVLRSTTFSGASFDSLQIGDWTTITGLSSGNKVHASHVIVQSESFVPGVSTVYVGGDILAINTNIGFLTVGDVAVYVGSIDARMWQNLQSGDYVEIYGTLPQSGQPVTATSVSAER